MSEAVGSQVDVEPAPGDGQGRSGSLASFKAVLANPALRRLQIAWAGSNLGTWGFGVALAVYAYDHGGAAAVGLVALLRWIPAAIAAPFMGALGDRHPRRIVMALSDLGRVVVVAIAGIAMLAGWPAAVVYALTTIGVIISTAFRPAQAALIPTLATDPHELTASNVVSSSIEAIGMFGGPAIGGLILAFTGPAAVLFVAATTFLWSAALIWSIEVDESGVGENTAEHERPSFFRHAFEGFSAVVREPAPRLLMSLFGLQVLVAGALVVFEVVIAFELLGRGNVWVGIIGAAFGVGGVIGAAISGALVGRNRLSLDFGAGLLLWGAPLVAVGIWPEPSVVLFAMVMMGIGNTLVDVSGMTLLQRSVPDELLARVFGVLETTILLGVAVGAGVAPVLVKALGPDTALVVVGLFLPGVVVLAARSLRRLDRSLRAPEGEVALLRGISLFAPLPAPVIERLARRLHDYSLPIGARVFEQGDPGDRFYVVAEGAVDIVRDGQTVTRVTKGGSFGEIALLREVPRQAGAVAAEEARLLALEGEDFVAAVSGHAASANAANAVIRSYGPLKALRAG